jgi:ABC-type nitrate/sulfonate/bicarbonate transport system substrate-binding protein
VTSRAFLKRSPDRVKKFMMAMATAVHEYKQNPDIAVPLTQKFLDIKDEEIARAAYQAYVKIYPDDLRPSLNGMQLVLDELGRKEAKAKSVNPAQIVDATTLDELEREGFFAKLQPKS